MSPTLTVLRKEFRENLRDRRTVFSALLFGPVLVPVLFAGMLAMIMHRGTAQLDSPVELAVSHAERAPNLVSRLAAYGVTLIRTDLDDAAARSAVRSGRYR
ncbi:MAG: ABC transporter permease, partial [Steroidobacteraceae bacterium]